MEPLLATMTTLTSTTRMARKTATDRLMKVSTMMRRRHLDRISCSPMKNASTTAVHTVRASCCQ
jgi:hypothetical protein